MRMSDYWALRLAEVERESHPGYYGHQVGVPAGHWRVDAGPGLPDGSRAVGEQVPSAGMTVAPVKRSWRDTPSGQSWMNL